MEIGVRQFWHDLRRRRYRFRQPVSLLFCILLVAWARPFLWGFVIGAGLCTAGLLLRLWASGYIRKSRVLETRGPYGLVRHPQYLGNTLVAVGGSLAVGRPLAIVAWALILYLFFVPAIRREDAKLHRRFGSAWEEWRQNTPALVPSPPFSTNPGLDLGEWSLRQCFHNGEPVWFALALLALTYVFLIGLPGF